MRRVDLTNYDVVGDDGKPLPYLVKDSLVNLLYNPDLRLNARDLMEHYRIAQKIEKGEELLEEADYARLKTSIECFRGFSRNDVELVRRVIDAPTVEVTEK